MLERVAGGVSRRQHFYLEPLEQRARTEFRRLQPLRDSIVHLRRGCSAQLRLNAEHFPQLVLEPCARWRGAEQLPMIGERLPDLAWILLGVRRLSVYRSDAQQLERHAARVQHPEDVVVGLDEKRRWIRERVVGRKNRRINVPVWGDDRQRARLVVQCARVLPNCRIGIKVAILVKSSHTTGFHRGSYSRAQRLAASASPIMCPFAGSVLS